MVRCSESLLCVCNSCFERYDFVRQIVDVGKENLFVEALSASFLHCLNPDVKCSPCAAGKYLCPPHGTIYQDRIILPRLDSYLGLPCSCFERLQHS